MMNENLIFALENICNIKNHSSGKKKVQKLIYLMERKGVAMDLTYSIHFYGPYSSDLDNVIHSLENNNIIKIDTSKKTHRIVFLKKRSHRKISECESNIIYDVIENFGNKTPTDLEVITTTDFVINNWRLEKKPIEHEIVMQVKRIKGNKFSEEQILSSIRLLQSQKLISI